MFEQTTNVSFAVSNFDWYCQYDATTFYNVPDESYCICNATTAADPDIAGIGVITSFAGMSLCTLIVALVPVWRDIRFKQRERLMKVLWYRDTEHTTLISILKSTFWKHYPKIRDRKNQQEVDIRESETLNMTPEVECWQTMPKFEPSPKQIRLLSLANRLLGNLCDLQLFTGLAIMMAGFAQGSNLSFYHQWFIINYWEFALISFWAGRQDQLWNDMHLTQKNNTTGRTGANGTVSTSLIKESAASSAISKFMKTAKRVDTFFRGNDRFRAYLRRSFLFICTILFVIFYGRVIWIQNYGDYWDPLGPGRCFLSHDKSVLESFWLWEAGTALYALTLLLSLVGKTKVMLLRYSAWIRTVEDGLLRVCVLQWRSLKLMIRSPPQRNLSWYLRAAVGLVVFAGLSTVMLVVFVLFQFLAIWTFGNGFYAVEVAFYLGNWAWCFYNIIDWKLSNKRVIVGNESAWGFGQVLAVVLMGALIFNLADALAEEKLVEKRLDSVSV